MSETGAQLSHDLFVSYSQSDRAWVEGYLLDALAAANVRVISELNFTLGAPRISEFERAIKHSKRTLLVLSPAYVAEAGMNFVDIMVQHYGLESGTWPVIPLLLDPVELPPRLAFLVALDATAVERWPEMLVRLCQTVQAQLPAPTPKPTCPYPGMRAFRQDEAAYFYGREAEVEELIQRLRLHPVIAVIGASGSGKSSLVFAGLLPALQRSLLFGAGAWLVRIVRPGAQPLTALKNALGNPVIEQFNPATLLATENGTIRLLLIIDQLEEVFTQGVAQSMAFFAAIEHLITLRDCYIVLTARADFFDQLLTSPLWPVIQAHRLEIAVLSTSGLRAAIVKPAENVSVFIESALVERLVAGSAGQPGLLPFVQEVMVRLWEKLERRYLPLRAYDALVLPLASYSGSERTGIQAAMAQLADEMISSLSVEQQRISRRIFLRLVQFGEGRDNTRRQQTVSILRTAGDDAMMFDHTLSYLVENRLIVLSGEEGGEPSVDLAHEALLTGWPQLRKWVTEGKDAELSRRRLEERAQEWVRLGRTTSALFDKRQYREVKAWLTESDQLEIGCSDDLNALIKKSKETIVRSHMITATAFGLLLTLSLLLVGNLVYRWWINRSWVAASELAQVSVKSMATSQNELAAGSLGYGVSFYHGHTWGPWETDGIPRGEPGKVLESAEANVDAVLALAYDPLRPDDLYAWIEGEGIFRLQRDTMTWKLLSIGGPVLTTASTPLAASNGSLIAIGDDLGIYVWNNSTGEWQHRVEASMSLDQEFEAVMVDKNGSPYLAGQTGVVYGSGDAPWKWKMLYAASGAQLIAIGNDGLIYISTVNADGAQILCLDANGMRIDSTPRLPVTNWLLQFTGALFKPLRVRAIAIVANPTLRQHFYVTTNQGAVFSMTCTGDREYLGQTIFIKAASSQLAVWQKDDGKFMLEWGNLGGLYQRELQVR